jgi:cytochrome P450
VREIFFFFVVSLDLFSFDSVAGVDTTSTSMAYLFWELSRRSDIMQKLQAELDEAMLDPRSVPNITVLYKLPYLTALLKEGALQA